MKEFYAGLIRNNRSIIFHCYTRLSGIHPSISHKIAIMPIDSKKEVFEVLIQHTGQNHWKRLFSTHVGKCSDVNDLLVIINNKVNVHLGQEAQMTDMFRTIII